MAKKVDENNLRTLSELIFNYAKQVYFDRLHSRFEVENNVSNINGIVVDELDTTKKVSSNDFKVWLMQTLIGNATEQNSGFMSSQDKLNLNQLNTLFLQRSLNGIIDAVNEMIEAFSNYPEHKTLIESFAEKVDKTTKVNGHTLDEDIALDKTDVGLNNVDNTSDINKPVSTATQSALDTKENLSNKTNLVREENSDDVKYPTEKAVRTELNKKVDLLTYTAFVNQHSSDYNALLTKVTDFLDVDDTTLDQLSEILAFIRTKAGSTELATGLSGKVDKTTKINNHPLNQDINLDKTDIGLNKVDNTSDSEKPVSTPQQTELDKKVDKTTKVNGHTLNNDVTVTKGDVGLGNVDNTSDQDKPVSNATQTELNKKVDKTTKVNGHALNGDVTIEYADIANKPIQELDNSLSTSKPICIQEDGDGEIPAPDYDATYHCDKISVEQFTDSEGNDLNDNIIRNFKFPINKPAGEYTFATLDDLLAQNVKFDRQIKTYYQLGKASGTLLNPIVIANAGDSLLDLIEHITQADELQPLYTNPVISNFDIFVPSTIVIEPGTVVSKIRAIVTVTEGTYSYDSTTGVDWTNFKYSSDNFADIDTTSHVNYEITLTTPVTAEYHVNKTVSVTVVGTYSDGSVANTNLGNPSSPAVKITGGTVTATASTVISPTVYPYIANSSSTDIPTSGTRKSGLIGNSGVSNYNCEQGKYVYVFTELEENNKSIQTYSTLTQQWADMLGGTVHLGTITFTMENGETFTYYAHRTQNVAQSSDSVKIRFN